MELTNLPKVYHEVGNTRFSCQYHVLFCTKYRRKVLSEEIIKDLLELIKEKEKEYDYQVLDMETSTDHVHLLLDISPERSPNNVVAKIKAYTSHVLRTRYRELCSRLPTLWTRVCFISTVGSVSLSDLDSFLSKQNKR